MSCRRICYPTWGFRAEFRMSLQIAWTETEQMRQRRTEDENKKAGIERREIGLFWPIGTCVLSRPNTSLTDTGPSLVCFDSILRLFRFFWGLRWSGNRKRMRIREVYDYLAHYVFHTYSRYSIWASNETCFTIQLNFWFLHSHFDSDLILLW